MVHISRKTSQKAMKRPQPYNIRERPRFRQSTQPIPPQDPASSSPQQLSSHHMHSPSTSSSSHCLDAQSARRACLLELIRERYPRYQPLNDFEIFVLGVTNDIIPQGKLRTWLDQQFAIQLACRGDPEEVLENARVFLDLSGGISGAKPRPGSRNVYVRVLPDSDYSLRLFPGNIALQEYCADFVRTSTGEAVDCPRGFELWSLAGSLGGGKLHSLERTFSSFVRPRHGVPQAETFVVKDGHSYILKRPGRRNIRFTVPVRQDLSLESRRDDHILDFPARTL